MRHAFVMDPLAGVKAHKDTSYYLMLAAQERGHEVFHLDATDLRIEHDRVCARLSALEVHADHDRPFTVLGRPDVDMGTMDVVWIRTDPPFDRRYLYSTLMLDLLPPRVRVVNRPSGIRNWNEKLAALAFPGLTPRTLVTCDAERVLAMLRECGELVLKPVEGFGGKGIEFVTAGEAGAEARIREKTAGGRQWIIAQVYLPEAEAGDKRILLLHGEPIGGILRLHAEGERLNNLDAGGTAHPTEIDDGDLEICRAIRPGLVDQGIVFCGIDVMGGRLIEINVTSPTGLQELCRFSGRDHHHDIVASLE